MKQSALLVSIPVVLVILSGCSGESTGAPPDLIQPNLSPSQEAALADGVVSSSEYESGYRQFLTCMAAAGFEVLEQGNKGQVYRYSYPVEAIDSGDVEACLDYHFREVDRAWQLLNEDSNDTSMALRACLLAENIPPGVGRAEIDKQIEEAGLDFVACVEEFG